MMTIKQLYNDEKINQILELWNQNVKETADCELDKSERDALEEQIKQYTQSTYGAVFVVINEQDQLVGYGIASMKQDLVSDIVYGQIDEVYVAPQYRRQKMAKHLVNDLMDWFHQNAVSFIHVQVDLENESALHFWERMGLEKEFIVLS
ncbi:GNAT family N-acetyltransferase [Bacillus sp. CLL-7-23]|uniref:GNAT family N-acetyltransferase n=1 Tax=Bacillus changyiensis TaxID=3004103 RepID=A0ABT4X3K1_9BACI|nr:GNAT family N-acetyltransferase [Bacillus changyiensis]MDA7026836.1 GNAT family N-acetyltransferase [Bacillus changyiensis]